MHGYSLYYTLLFFLFFPFSLSAQSLDDYWDDRFDLPGVQGEVHGSALAANGDLYILGDILGVPGLPDEQTLLKWDGIRWSSPGLSGDSLLADGARHRITNTQGPIITIGNTLYITARRDPDKTNNLPATTRVLALNGNGWQAIGEGFNQAITALATDGSTLYAAGRFTRVGDSSINALARWNGTAWENVGGGVNGNVAAMTVDRYGALYVTGTFTRAGSTQAPGGARWNGTEWNSFGGREMNEGIVRLATVGITLYALRQESSPTLYRLEGDKWLDVSAPVETDYTLRLSPLFTDSIGSIYLAAARQNDPTSNPSFLLQLNNNVWSALPAEFNERINTAAFAGGARMVVGGLFTAVNHAVVNGITEWDGLAWRALSPGSEKDKGLVGEVAAVETDGDYFYAAGADLQSRDLSGSYAILRRRVEGSWETMAEGINGEVKTLARNPAGGLYVGGCFDRAGSAAASNIALWDGAAWRGLGTGPGFCVADIAAANGMVYVVGGSILARWNGQTWTRLAEDIEGEGLAVAVGPDGTIYVGGRFTTAGKVRVNNVAAWRNGVWSSLGEGLRIYNSSATHPGSPFPIVRTLALDGNDLYAGGLFDSAGSAEAYNIARWNGEAWSGMYTGLTGGTQIAVNWTVPPEVRDIRVTPDYIFAGGHFHTAGKAWETSEKIPYETSSGVAFWDKKEERWNSVGAGVAALDRQVPLVRSIAIDGNQLFIGGDFTSAAARPSYRIARMDIPPPVFWGPITADGIDFGAVPMGSYRDSVLVISNPATSTRTLSGRIEITAGPFAMTAGTVFGVAPGKTTRIPIRFVPDRVGFIPGGANIRHNSPAVPQNLPVPLWGTGLPPVIEYAITPLAIDFGDQLQRGTPIFQDIRITNLSSSTQSLTVTADPLAAPFIVGFPSGDNNPLGSYILAPKQALIYRITADLSAIGNYNTQLTVRHNANSGGTIEIPVHLRVVKPVAVMNITPNPIDFGDVRLGTSPSLSMTIGNDPGSNISFAFLSAQTEEPFGVKDENRGTTMWPGRETKLTVSFTPPTTGEFESFVEISREVDGVITTDRVPVRGRGVEGIISPFISPQEIDFGDVRLGRNKEVMLTVGNAGDATLPLRIEYEALDAPLSVAQPGSHTIQPGSARTYAVRFAPTGPGIYRDTIFIAHNAPGLPTPLIVPVRGESRVSGTAEENIVTGEMRILRAEPNPASGSTRIRFRTERAGTATLTVYAADGREVAHLIDGPMEAGEHAIDWNTAHVEAGIYLCRLKLGEKEETYTVVVRR